VAKIFHFAENNSIATLSRELFGNFPKKLAHLKEKNYEIVKIF
jgi:hypothetical protein